MAETQSDTNAQPLVIKLPVPVEFEGNSVSEIDLSALDNWSAEDLIRVKKQFESLMGADITPSSVMLPESNLEYGFIIAVDVTGMPMEFFKSLKAKDALKVRTAVINFFLGEG